jgi:hypothetical protein
LILDEFIDVTNKNKQIIGWTVTIDEQLSKLNLGISEEPRILVSDALPEQFQMKVKQLLIEFKDAFSWSYKKLKGIPISIYEHKNELTINAHPTKQ